MVILQPSTLASVLYLCSPHYLSIHLQFQLSQPSHLHATNVHGNATLNYLNMASVTITNNNEKKEKAR